ncbi:MAG: DUF488 domain-containing protein [Armatimonadetes bacterium]|nr:DUF488 domain-containing protein [Armatimonadota bacterium]
MERASERARVYTIGHSNHPIEKFVGLLRRYSVGLVIDVRSRPYSKQGRHFDRTALRTALETADIGYLYLGNALGGLPDGPEYYDEIGRVQYGTIADTDLFREAIAVVGTRATRSVTALMCSEEDPVRCHRHVLLGKVLTDAGADVLHIRGNGDVETETQVEMRRARGLQPALF